jgi:hypothetical protein
MNKRVLLTIVIALLVISLGAGAWLIFGQAQPPTTLQEVIESPGVKFPVSAAEIDWDNREVFEQGLTSSALDALESLPQASTYYISLEIPPDLISSIQGHLIVRYFNNEDLPLGEIYFRLYPNFQGGVAEVSHLAVDGIPLIPSLESENTALRVDLAKALQPGESNVVEMDFSLAVPTEMGGNYGLFGYFEDVLVLDTFYPMIPAFDESGWYSQVPQENGDLTYQDASFYLVQVKAPADLVLASSGIAVKKALDGDTQTTVFAAGPARDFYLAGSREFVEVSERTGETTVKVLTRPEYSINQAYALDYALNAIRIYSDVIAPYMYTEFEVISSPMRALGIEYPGITSIVVDEFQDGVEIYGLPSEQMLESTLAHETAHMWFYNAVGNDQQRQPWVDEALVQYITYIYYLERYGNGEGYIDSWRSRWQRVADADIPIGMPAGDYHGAEYSGIVYGRGPLFFYQLEEDYGLEMVLSAIQAYYQDHQWDNAYTADLRKALEDSCGCDLESYFEDWVYSD